MTASEASSSSGWRDILESCSLIAQRMQAALACESLLILHHSKWRCLARSFSLVLQELEHACDCVLQGSLEAETNLLLIGPLRSLHQAVEEAETCLQEFFPRNSHEPTHYWLVEKALKQGMSTDVVDVHLHDLLWASSTVRERLLWLTPLDSMELDMMQYVIELQKIWAQVDAQNDFLSAQKLLNKVTGGDGDEGKTALELADFILHKLSHIQDSHNTGTPDLLPRYIWVDSECLKRNPDLLGQGGYGQIHEATWLSGRFAVKDFFPVTSEVFEREAAIQASLCHPNVIPLVCCTNNSSLNRRSLVMELMQQDLQILMIRRKDSGIDPPFPLLLAVDLMLQIAKGMEYLHSLHIIHRDLKSSNILVSFGSTIDGFCAAAENVSAHVRLKIADFGMSKTKYASARYTTKQAGTTAWMAPEVFETDPEDAGADGDPNAKYTNKADVYSFGLVCYEILTGKSPYEGSYIRRRVLAGERPRLPPHCPPALSSYIKMCWCAQPTRRPPFIQICRMLRYFKASILLQDHYNHNQAHHNWLLHPLLPSTCASIDGMFQSFLFPPNALLVQPRPLSIPLEMYSCRLVLQDKDHGAKPDASQFTGESTSQSALAYGTSGETIRSALEGLSEAALESLALGELDTSGRKAKSRFPVVSEWVKRLFCMSIEEKFCMSIEEEGWAFVESELRGMVGHFTFKELQLATHDFSNVIGRGGSWISYYGMLVNGQEIEVKTACPGQTYLLMKELQITNRLRHQAIRPLLGWCKEKKKVFLVLEFMANGSLVKHIFEDSEYGFGWQQRYKVVCQLAGALKYLHQDSGYKKIVHRDVKTANVYLDSDWNAWLGDFSIALCLDNSNASLVDNVAGTLGYMAPECLQNSVVSPASDVYGFGVTILEIACGQRVMHDGHYLIEWVWGLCQRGEAMNALDAHLEGNFDEEEMMRLLLLGLACTNADPETRPTIEEVLRILAGLSQPPPLRVDLSHTYPMQILSRSNSEDGGTERD